MATSILTYANRAKVAEALTAEGYPVTRMTVNRWAAGAEMPGIAARMVLKLFGHDPDIKETAPPVWAERLAQDVADAVTGRLFGPHVQQLEDELRRLGLLPVAEPIEESPGPQDTVDTGQPRLG